MIETRFDLVKRLKAENIPGVSIPAIDLCVREARKGMVPASEVVKMKDLLRCFVQDDPCSFDHKKGCQAHGFISLTKVGKCPNAEAKAILMEKK